MKNKFFVFVGEKSADNMGQKLLVALKNSSPDTYFLGVGGPLVSPLLDHKIASMEDFQIMGFSKILLSFPKIYRQFHYVKNTILKEQPDVVILIDYADFNLRLAEKLKKSGYQGKIVQYVSPTVWAWRKHRMKKMEKYLDLLLVIFPFEKNLFEKSRLSTVYVGNPVVENIHNHTFQKDWKTIHSIPDTKPLIAVFPGSRHKEITLHLDLLCKSIQQIHQKYPKSIFVFSCPKNFEKWVTQKIQKYSLTVGKEIFLVSSSYTYDLMQDCTMALSKCGTITLELALHKKPSIIFYRASKFNYFVAKHIFRIRIPYFCMTNILANREIFPELTIDQPTPQNLFQSFCNIYEKEEKKHKCIEGCKEVIHLLKEQKSSLKACEAIIKLMKNEKISV